MPDSAILEVNHLLIRLKAAWLFITYEERRFIVKQILRLDFWLQGKEWQIFN